jgi:hypothetical protein
MLVTLSLSLEPEKMMDDFSKYSNALTFRLFRYLGIPVTPEQFDQTQYDRN